MKNSVYPTWLRYCQVASKMIASGLAEIKILAKAKAKTDDRFATDLEKKLQTAALTAAPCGTRLVSTFTRLTGTRLTSRGQKTQDIGTCEIMVR